MGRRDARGRRLLGRKRLREKAFPGTAELFVFGQDVFSIVAGTENRAATQEFLNTVAGEEAQIEVNQLKGTLPAVAGIDLYAHAFSDAQKAAYEHYNSVLYRLPAVHGFKPDEVMSDLAPLAKAMIESGDTSELVAYVTANYALLRQ